MLDSSWTRFVSCSVILVVVAHALAAGSNSRSDSLTNSGNSGATSSSSSNTLNSSPLNSNALNNLVNSVAEPKAIGNNNWYHYGSPYTVVAHQQPLQQVARDSYADSATDLGYGVPAVGGHGGGVSGGYSGGGGGGYSGGIGGGGYGGGGGGGYGGGGYDSAQGTTYHYQLYPAASGGYGDHHHDDDDGFGGFSGGGGGSGVGLLGLLGLKGLKGLKVVKGLKALALFSPVLLPLLAPLLLLLALPLLLLALPLLLFLPIPVITVPAAGRSLTLFKETARMAQSVASSEECVERISCEAARVARGFGFDSPWVQSFLEKTAPQNKWIERVSRGVKSTECKKYSCGQVTSTKKSLQISKDA